MPTLAAHAAPRRALIADRGGNIAILTALMLPVLVGACGLGSEVAYWFYSARAMQNAADSAAVAAATNGSSSYATEAQAVMSLYGYQNGAGEVTVSASNAAACPAGGSNCYSVTITKLTPLFLSQIVGFKGTTTVNGVPYTRLTATATAAIEANGDACVLVLDPTGNAMSTTGGNTTLSNCDLQVNSNSSDALTTTGGVITASGINVVGGYSQTGGKLTPTPTTGAPPISDPYAGLYAQNNVASIGSQSQPCTTTAAKTFVGGSGSLAAGNYCGGISVTGSTVTFTPGPNNQYNGVTISGGTVTLAPGIYNGLSITGGKVNLLPGTYVITAGTGETGETSEPPVFTGLSNTGGQLSGTGVTFVLTNNDDGGSYATASLTGGTTNLTAPTSGAWAGMLFYQDPTTPENSAKFTGGNSTYTGTLYFPTQSMNYTGGSNNSTCTQIVTYELTLTGGSTIGSSCTGTGVQAIPVKGRGKLVS
jgi:Flp pilus assembly protein TadG